MHCCAEGLALQCLSFVICKKIVKNSKVPQNLGKRVLEAVVLAVNVTMNEYLFSEFKGFFSCKDRTFGKSTRPCKIFFTLHKVSSGSKDWDRHLYNHINMIYTKARRLVGMLRQFYQDADTAILRELYVSNIRPLLEYVCQLWLCKEGCKYTRISSEVCLVSFFKTVGCWLLHNV